jgi:aspartyl-tRNA(Asn)/glutamyl-tRNA(Gln) amidotransferase subunit B
MNKKESNNWKATIGLEIHAELKTESKMFCGCKNNPFNSGPNENVCPVCLGMPGTLPVLNKKAIEDTILTGLALNCKVNKFTKWDRKNYFYPDIPKGYQISQYDLPLVYDGYLEIANSQQLTANSRKIGITRIHLEEDTGTSKHPEGREDVDYSLLDFNRAGVPLMELVTEPDIRSASEAKEFCKNYQQILRTLGVADADMEKGQMRCEANISVRKISNNKYQITNKLQNSNDKYKKLGTKVEVKNLNSFRSVEKAIEYEIERQIEAIENGEKIVQETRGWDEKKNQTYIMRKKETSADYRYFPEPDIPPIILIGENSKFQISNNKKIPNSKLQNKNIINIDKIRKKLPELPKDKAIRYVRDYKLSKSDAQIIANDLEKAEYFDKISQNSKLKTQNHIAKLKTVVNFMINEIPDLSVRPEYLAELIDLIDSGKISQKIAKDILPEIKKGKSPEKIIKEKRLEQVSDTGEIDKIVEKIIKENPDAVAKIKSGQMGVIGFLVGQVMSSTKGRANPGLVNQIIRNKLV